MTGQEIKKSLDELYAEKQELQEKLHHCLGNIDDFEERLEKWSKENEMKEFNSLEELQDDEDLQHMCRSDWRIVKLKGRKVYACTTNQQYEDIIWGGAYEILKELFAHFEIKELHPSDYSSDIRDFILEKLEENGIEFVDVFDEY